MKEFPIMNFQLQNLKNNVERIISKWIAEFKNFETKDIITI